MASLFTCSTWYNNINDKLGEDHLTLKHRETPVCIVSTVATDALVLKYWLNIQFIGPVSYENITLLLHTIWK